MAERVMLHVGAPKTGTSYLEAILWKQLAELEEDGVWLPGRRRRAHDALMGEVRGGIWRRSDVWWTWARVAEAARRRNDTVLVTKEMLSGAAAERTRIALDPLDGEEVHVIVTVRQLAGALPSAWQQLVKAGDKTGFGQWLSDLRVDSEHGFWRHHDPVSILERWAADIPPERVHVIVMPSGPDPTELWQRFASVIGVDPSDYRTPERPPNESLGAIEVEVLRRINLDLRNRLPMRLPYLENVHHAFTKPVLIGSSRDRRKFGVPASYADWLDERSDQMIKDLATFGYDVVGDLEELRPRLDPTLPSPDEVTEEEIARTTTQYLADFLVEQAPETARSPGRPAGS